MTLRTLIDVVLHNGSAIDHVWCIDFPYSDHRIVIAACNFKSEKAETITKSSLRRTLNANTFEGITRELEKINFDFEQRSNYQKLLRDRNESTIFWIQNKNFSSFVSKKEETPLSLTYNSCVNQQIFIYEWKIALVIP
jgi:hypothetical protein